MAKAKKGDRVKIDYRGTLSDGSEFDSSSGKRPLEFTIGSGSVISGFNDAVIGMEAGQSKTVILSPSQAYGEREEKNMIEVSRAQMPQGAEPMVGTLLKVNTPHGDMPVTITELKEETMVLDANHPLAGKELTFELKLLEIL